VGVHIVAYRDEALEAVDEVERAGVEIEIGGRQPTARGVVIAAHQGVESTEQAKQELPSLERFRGWIEQRFAASEARGGRRG
jgi:hypothetical protein